VEPPYQLDGKNAPIITAYLLHSGGHEDPFKLKTNQDSSFIGSYLNGMGFTFDDSDESGVATPLAEMQKLIDTDSKNSKRIFPFIGGEEVNNSPTLEPHRHTIDFFDLTLEEAEAWPDLLKIVREKVKPERDRQKRPALRERW